MDVTIGGLGHWLYCRQLRWENRVGDLFLPDSAAEDGVGLWPIPYAEILAVGRDCGLPRNIRGDKRLEPDRVKWIVALLRPGMALLCPAEHPWGIERSPFWDWEFFIDEDVPLAYWESVETLKEDLCKKP